MGSEDLHHKRKREASLSLKRLKNKRESYDFVLIVCEGEKTEPNYLAGLCDDLQLSSTNIKVMGVGADPLSLVNFALQEFDRNKDYDRVYCIFDKDTHSSYQNALIKVASCSAKKINRIPIYAITSVPCFEYWLLLHFIDSTRPYVGAGSKSAGDQLFTELKKHMPKFTKGCKDIYNMTQANLQTAINRAKKNHGLQDKDGKDNPTTKMYQLVEYLMNLKKSK